MQGIVAGVAARWFTPEFVVRQPELVERIVELVRGTDPRGYLEACAAIRDMDLRSSLAAVQAPIIMMSQNRQEAKDRLRSEYDYKINLKAELEIRHLHEKIDHLLKHQWERLVEIQQIQIEILHELVQRHKER